MAFALYDQPSEFGNDTATTCYIGGSAGVVNCTGGAFFNENVTANNLIGNISAGNEGDLDVNSSKYWVNASLYNGSVFQVIGETFDIVLSFFTDLFYQKSETYNTSEVYNKSEIEGMNTTIHDNLSSINTDVYNLELANVSTNARITDLNQSFNDSTLLKDDDDFLSVNQSWLETLFYTITQIEIFNTSLYSIFYTQVEIEEMNNTLWINVSNVENDLAITNTNLNNLESNFTEENTSIWNNISNVENDLAITNVNLNNLEDNVTGQNTSNYNEFLLANGSNPLTDNWDAGDFNITAEFKGFFYGVYDWIVGSGTSSEYNSFDGTQLDFNETTLNETIDEKTK